jgi:hypothetical protein
MSTTAERGRLIWPKALRKKIHPWNGYAEAKPPKPNLKTVFKRLKEVRGIAGKIKASQSSRKFKERVNAAVERLDSLEGSRFTTPEVEAVGGVLMGMVDPAWPRGDEIGQDLVHLWAQQGGVVAAAQTIFCLWKLQGADGVVKDSTQALIYPKAYIALRNYLATCLKSDYDKAVDAATIVWQQQGLLERCVLAYLFPEQTEWVNEAASSWLDRLSTTSHNYQVSYIGYLLVASVKDKALLEQIAEVVIINHGHRTVVDYLPTLVARVGLQAQEPLAAILAGCPDAASKKKCAAALAVIATEFSFSALIPWLKDKTTCGLVSEGLMAAPELAIPCLQAALSESEKGAAPLQATLDSLLAAANDTPNEPEAEQSGLPAVLRDPPWKRKPKKVEQPKVDALEMIVDAEVIHWRKGDDWHLDTKELFTKESSRDVARRVIEARRTKDCQFQSHVLRVREEDNPLALLNESSASVWNPYSLRGDVSTPLRLLKRFGPDCIPALVKCVAVAPVEFYGALSRLESSRVAPIMAEAMARRKQQRKLARQWLKEYPERAALGLIPDALAGKGKVREQARRAIQYLVLQGHAETLRQAAQQYGQQAAAAFELVLAIDPLETHPKVGTLPTWFRPSALPRPSLKAGGTLSEDSIELLGTMLSFSPLDDPYAGLEQLRVACTSESLEAFAWGVFLAWELSGADPKQDWALNAVGHLGGDDSVRKLNPLVRRWPGEGFSKRAALGLRVLAAIGTDLALMHLYGISQKIRFKALKNKAEEMIQEIAEHLELSTEELGDRLVPDLGLDNDGSRRLDFGSRAFTVGFNESLLPFVLDEEGRRRKALPKPNQSDDAEKSDAARKTWKSLKKDVKAVAKGQLERLERAMSMQRRWAEEDFRSYLLGHPLLMHLVRRLVWGCYEDGRLVDTFRVAEDRTFATREDDATKLHGEIGIAHPLEFEEQLAAWQTLFADYKLIQPFPQLSRPVYRPTKEEMAGNTIDRFAGREMKAGFVLGLERKGWHRGYVDSGCIAEMNRQLSCGRDAVLSIDPGVYLADFSETPVVVLDEIKLPGGVKVKDLDLVEFSELVSTLDP